MSGKYTTMLPPSMIDDPVAVTAFWRAEVQRAGLTPAGPPTWRLIDDFFWATVTGQPIMQNLIVEGPTL